MQNALVGLKRYKMVVSVSVAISNVVMKVLYLVRYHRQRCGAVRRLVEGWINCIHATIGRSTRLLEEAQS